VACSRSAAVFEACDSCQSASPPGASARTPSISSCKVGAGVIRQRYIDGSTIVNSELTTISSSVYPERTRQPRLRVGVVAGLNARENEQSLQGYAATCSIWQVVASTLASRDPNRFAR
jgi:hypothetical protein